LGKQDFYHVEEGWIAIHVKPYLIENYSLLSNQLVLTAVEAACRLTIEHFETCLEHLLIIALLLLSRLVPRKLSQELP